MKEIFIKKTALGTMIGEVKKRNDGTVSIFTALNKARIYQGDVPNMNEAWAWFTTHGYHNMLTD